MILMKLNIQKIDNLKERLFSRSFLKFTQWLKIKIHPLGEKINVFLLSTKLFDNKKTSIFTGFW